MEFDDDRKENAIEKANERWNSVHSHHFIERLPKL